MAQNCLGIATACLAACLTSPIYAKEPPPNDIALARLDGYAAGLRDAETFSGVVLVAHNGNILFERAYGPRDPVKDEPASLTTRYNIASAGKMFTATAILQLIAAKKISLDSKVGSVIKNYPNKVFAEKVTIRHLLTHTAGAGDIDLFGAEMAGNRERAKTTQQMLALHWDRPPAFDPGSRQEYGNFGHVVLGRIIEVTSGEPFEQYISNHIFKPAGMTATSFTDCADNSPDIAVGYAIIDGKSVKNCATQPKRGFAAGGQISTAHDLLRFTESLGNGTLLPPALFGEATRTHREFMGLGFFATGYGADVPKRDFRWGHGGSTDGVCTDVRTYPETGEAIIILSNRDAPSCYGISNFLHAQK